MITVNDVLEDLKNIINKTNLLKKTYPNNYIWIEILERVSGIVDLINKDRKIYGW